MDSVSLAVAAPGYGKATIRGNTFGLDVDIKTRVTRVT